MDVCVLINIIVILKRKDKSTLEIENFSSYNMWLKLSKVMMACEGVSDET